MSALTVILPLRIYSLSNERMHWARRAKLARQQRHAAHYQLRAASRTRPALPVTVTLTRIAPKQLDDDNLAGGFKHVRDGVADWLGTHDADPRVTWRYAQQKGAPGAFSALIQIDR